MAKENIQYYDEYKGLFRVREKDKEKFWRSSMFKVFRHYLLIIFILIIVTGNAAFSAIINQYQPVNREAIGETLGRAAYDRVKGIRGKIIGYEPTDYILNNETNTDIIIELHLLNIDVTRYFNKTVKEYTFQIMKHVWSIPFDVTVVAVDDKILRLYYSKRNMVIMAIILNYMR